MEPRTPFGKLLCYALLLVGSVMFLFPFVWLVSTSLKPNEQASTMPPQWIPVDYHTEIDGEYLQVKRGEEIKVAAVLVDPKLDIMIRRLYDTSVKGDKEYKDATGKVYRTIKVNKSLDPNVVIARADGQIVAEGVMPFG